MKIRGIKIFLPLAMIFLLMFLLCFDIDTNAPNNSISLNSIRLSGISHAKLVIIDDQIQNSDDDLVDVDPIDVLWMIPILLFFLIIHHVKNSYEYHNWSRLFLKLYQLLIPKYHMSNYKGFLSAG
ncbi:hypothetical protein CACET_c34060 [Clostridium aceticum]|uniref:Uncharacterized protein n=1 Tax=Clostridium aceticum TaxID=84022 RepID=A0A0D8IC87_9CLOT|nr:hypothetical protein [Clostridium aceticum]AKL96849.1 hypothetical protein CACET_c34060 [Clostridium aceticum]KJF27592.1 hypothetical protein TZ02_07360 [Clostridium aceticum]